MGMEQQTMHLAEKILISLVSFLLLRSCTSIDTITPNQPIKDGDILISKGQSFALGFFSPGNSSNRYIGIWYNNVSEQTVVWVANRDNPITNLTGVISIDTTGNLVLTGENSNMPVWSTSIPAITTTENTSSAQLLDSGNLILVHGDRTRVVAWQSFDYPTNTILPYMKLGVDRKTGLNRFLTSWKSIDDPGTGEYSFKMDLNGSPQVFLYKGTNKVWRTGPWNGLRWSGVPQMTSNFIFNVTYVDNTEEIFMMYGIHNPLIVSRMVMNESGVIERATWHDKDRRWVGFWHAPEDKCDNYRNCGVNSNCDYNSGGFECTCLTGFEPKSASDWYLRDGSKGCERTRGRQVCGDGEGFVKVARAKLPDTSIATLVDNSMNLRTCEEMCKRNCSCTGYASGNVSERLSGCISWYGDLIDTRLFLNGGQDFYVRVDAVELAQHSKKTKSLHGKRLAIIVAVSVAAMLLILSLAYWLHIKKRRGTRGRNKLSFSFNPSSPFYERSYTGKEIDQSGTNSDLPFFDLSAIIAATDSFSLANKLGEGGFGSVYKGRLHNGEEIAVKRLSKSSGQGTEEFKNEVTLIARLQHRNLVRLLGCCIQQEEKMLIYEYLPNKGLDSFIFDKEKGSMVDWRKRFEIVLGIARGMVYLHQDSRLRIVHRDLKASNVLLDATMNPKISDFGMAKIFDGDQIAANTNRIVGTYGYMSPEYALEGQFSTKSDVFSFGVLLLEIITGRKNNSYYMNNSVNLIGHVWDLWQGGRPLDVVDSALGESYQAHQVLRCIHIGFLCVQEFASDRPTMSEVTFMLCNETQLPSPSQPAFIFKRSSNAPNSSSSTSAGANSLNNDSITKVEAR